jgi:selenobiotic family peptide radical SAM maturase
MTAQQTDHDTSAAIFTACRALLSDADWQGLLVTIGEDPTAERLVEALQKPAEEGNRPPFLGDLARLEFAAARARGTDIPLSTEQLCLNPSAHLLDLSWSGLTPFLFQAPCADSPEPHRELVVVWKEPVSHAVKAETASPDVLLALKLLAEGIDPVQAAAEAHVPVRAIDSAIERAATRGIVLAPASRIRRDPAAYRAGAEVSEDILSSPTFTLQWHITQACDLHCKHCYDRSDRSGLPFDKARRVLDDLYDFCRNKHVRGQVSFSGGNPFLYPRFADLYREAWDRGFMIAILGNPTSRERIEELLTIGKPVYVQVSLEGMEEHNDAIRGPGHFRKTLDFLALLRELGVYSMVMLTLTAENVQQVVPLAELLRDKTDLFTFNRLAMVGEGEKLRLPPPGEYAAFLERYIEACAGNPALGLKDNLLNIVYQQRGDGLFSGCTGHGCGAAFNFLTLLSDGEVHACRKFPSPVGNIFDESLSDIYDSDRAERYRRGCSACGGCELRHVCGGCLAVTYGHGLDPLTQRDPYCFKG